MDGPFINTYVFANLEEKDLVENVAVSIHLYFLTVRNRKETETEE